MKMNIRSKKLIFLSAAALGILIMNYQNCTRANLNLGKFIASSLPGSKECMEIKGSEVTLSWEASTEDLDGTPISREDIKQFNIFVENSLKQTSTYVSPGDSTKYTVQNLKIGETYRFSITQESKASLMSAPSNFFCAQLK